MAIDNVVRTMQLSEAAALIGGLQEYVFSLGQGYGEAVKLGRRISGKVPESDMDDVNGYIRTKIGSAAEFYPDDHARLSALNAHLTENLETYILSASDTKLKTDKIWKVSRFGNKRLLFGGGLIGAAVGAILGYLGPASSVVDYTIITGLFSLTGAVVPSAIREYLVSTHEGAKLRTAWNARKQGFLDDAVAAFTSN